MKKELLAISGKLNHGKDTLVDYIISAYVNKNIANATKKYPGPSALFFEKFIVSSIEIKKLSFADPIKEMALIMFPQLVRDDLWGPSQNKAKEIKGYKNMVGERLKRRDVLLDIGKLGRQYNINCWAWATLSKAEEFRTTCPVIITDCRFKSEFKLIKEAGGKIIRVVRPDVVCTSKDQSEIDLDDIPLNRFDKVVTNDSLDSLIKEAALIVDEYFEI